jgi:hypothetical protein
MLMIAYGVRETRRVKRLTFFTSVNRHYAYTQSCAVKPLHIYKIKKVLLKSVYYATEYTINSLVLVGNQSDSFVLSFFRVAQN